jgi:hypothetical protein
VGPGHAKTTRTTPSAVIMQHAPLAGAGAGQAAKGGEPVARGDGEGVRRGLLATAALEEARVDGKSRINASTKPRPLARADRAIAAPDPDPRTLGHSSTLGGWRRMAACRRVPGKQTFPQPNAPSPSSSRGCVFFFPQIPGIFGKKYFPGVKMMAPRKIN